MKHLPEKDNQFYPTPKSLSDKLFSMLSSKKTKYRNILEPSAGKGDLIKSFLSDLDYYDKQTIVFHCCETDKNLCSILSALNNDSGYDSNIKIVGSDFLEFWGCEQRAFTYRYIWLCYAIVWGIKKFDELNKE